MRWLWHWGTYGDKGLQTKRKFTEGIEDDLLDQDPYPPSPNKLPRNSPIAESIVKPISTSKSALVLPVATNEVVTIAGSSSRRILDTGVVIGRALPQSCLDPNVRPVVRAMISKVGSLVAYVPGKYPKRNATKRNIQIAMTHVEYTPELTKYSFGEGRSRAIKAMIEGRTAPDQRDATPDSCLSTTSPPLPIIPEPSASELLIIALDDSQHQGLLTEGVVIGRAEEHWCLRPHKRPVVRAMLNKKNAVMAFIPAQHAKHVRTNSEVQMPLKEVDFSESFAALPPWKIAEAIRARIRTKIQANGNHAMHEPGGRMGAEAKTGEEEEEAVEAP